jgi:hypothetical protein
MSEHLKIYGSCEYMSPEEKAVGDLQLEVNSMWKFPYRDVCFKVLSSGNCIEYDLKECVEVINEKTTKWAPAEVTKEIAEELVKMGYTLTREYKSKEEGKPND